MFDKLKKYLTPFNITFAVIALTIFFVVLFLGIVPTGLWWAYVIYFGVWILLGILFVGPKLFKK